MDIENQKGGAYLGLPYGGHDIIYTHAITYLEDIRKMSFYKSNSYIIQGLLFPDVPCPNFEIGPQKNVILIPEICGNFKNVSSFF